ncbi:MAG: aldehyde ferredoxin oxidoreductase family protein [Promethearchaeota archaeon]|jgi:aldehyde:ferredoxin oxidoreductase
MTNGYFGKILWVDLSEGVFKEENLPEEYYRSYLGGYGLAAKLLYEHIPAKTDPLSSESIFGFFPGLLTGTMAPMTGRFMVAGKSPLTGTWGDSNCGGYFGPEIKRCGFDAILIKGKASTPKYITIIDGDKQIIDATDLWGLDTVQTEEKLTEKHGKIQVASIGQAGENLSLISGIVNDKARIAGRSGLGAVMGSKNLKAIVLKGSNKISLADKDLLSKYTKEYNQRIQESKGGITQIFKTFGTTAGNTMMVQIGDTPVKNWNGTAKEDYPSECQNKISGMEINKYRQKAYGCFSCPVHCGAIMKVPEVGLEETHRPEYETCAVFGPMLLNDDLMSIFTINDLCNRAGIDTISAGTAVAFAIECYENGIINKDETDGLELNWGNSSAIVELVKKIIDREGIGDILADGVKRASEKIGKESHEYAVHSGGQELGMHSSKFYKSMGATFAFDPTPGRHTTPTLDFGSFGPIGKPNGLFEGFALPEGYKDSGDSRSEAEKLVVGIWQSLNSLGLCEFVASFLKYPLLELITGVVGWDITIDELIKTGLRIQTLRQAFTLREGIDIINNKLPSRAVGIDYLADYKSYCKKMGWNPENAYPLEETLKDLNLGFVITDLY